VNPEPLALALNAVTEKAVCVHESEKPFLCDPVKRVYRVPHVRDRHEMRGVPRPTDPLDDFYDDFRYGIYSFLKTPTKPYGMRVADRLKKAIEVDPTRAVVDYNKILREEKNEEEPQQYSRHAGLAKADQRTRTGAQAEQVKKMRSSIVRGPQTQVYNGST
jgi:hypothetical protein